jgi:hypothetical protein
MATNPSGGLNPLGSISVVSGTPIRLNTNVGVQGQGPLKMASRYQQIIISCPTANTGDVYLVAGNNTAAGHPAAIIGVIPPGRSIPFPNGLLVNSKINIDHLWLDASTGTQVAIGCAVYG